MLTSHPSDARYFSSRRLAYSSRLENERVIRLGWFQGGSFGCYPKVLGNGLYVGQVAGGPIPSVCVWMTTKN